MSNVPTWTYAVILAWFGALAVGVAVMWLTGPRRERRRMQARDNHTAQVFAAKAHRLHRELAVGQSDDELAEQERLEFEQALREWGR